MPELVLNYDVFKHALVEGWISCCSSCTVYLNKANTRTLVMHKDGAPPCSKQHAPLSSLPSSKYITDMGFLGCATNDSWTSSTAARRFTISIRVVDDLTCGTLDRPVQAAVVLVYLNHELDSAENYFRK